MFERISHPVREVRVADASAYDDGGLSLDLRELERIAADDPRIEAVKLDVAMPGDRVRVVSVLDIFDARWSETGPTYPGLDGGPVTAGSRRTHVLDGFQIIGSSRLPSGDGGLMVARPACVDFWGTGSELGPFGTSPSLAADIVLDQGLQDKVAADGAVRDSLVRLSTAIGRLAMDAEGETWTIPSVTERAGSELPKVAYVYQIQSQKAPLQTFLYGVTLDDLYPTVLDPIEVLDGAVVSGNRGLQTIPTISHVNNPVLLRLLHEDGKRLSLLPVVLMEGHQKTTASKERSARQAVQLLSLLGARGAVLTQEGGGMSIVDQMLVIELAKERGIVPVAITYEMSGSAGTDTPLIYFSRAATHLVSTGNREERVHLEAPDQVVGRGAAENEFGDFGSEVVAPLYAVYGATSQVGLARVRSFAA